MKFTRILGLVVLLGCSAVVAHADGGSDPTVKVNKFPDPTCPPSEGANYTCFSTNSAANPLFIPSNNIVANYVWDGVNALTTLYVEFPFISGDSYTCTSNVFLNCSVQEPAVNQATDIEFVFSGGSIAPCTAAGDCTGVSTVVAPEPSSALLLFAGLISLLAFARKRLMNQTSSVPRELSA